jgi:hypothetical protein
MHKQESAALARARTTFREGGDHMERIEDSRPFDWIRARRGVELPVPMGFPEYCKLLHPIHEDLSIADHEITWNDTQGSVRLPDSWTEAQRQQYLHLRSRLTILRGASPVESPIRRLRWKELADRYGMDFSPEVDEESFRTIFPVSWPRYLVGPDHGNLGEETRLRVVTLLAPFTGNQPCYFYFEPIPVEDVVYRGALIEVLNVERIVDPTLSPSYTGLSPTYWWPEDQTWCVYSDYGLPFTVVAGSEQLIDTFLGDRVLECVRLSYA